MKSVPSGVTSSANKPNVNIPEDIEGDSVTDPNVELDRVSDSDSELGDYDVPAESSDCSVLEQDNQGFGTPVSGTLKGENTKWFIL